jgi:hypothetical protein
LAFEHEFKNSIFTTKIIALRAAIAKEIEEEQIASNLHRQSPGLKDTAVTNDNTRRLYENWFSPIFRFWLSKVGIAIGLFVFVFIALFFIKIYKNTLQTAMRTHKIQDSLEQERKDNTDALKVALVINGSIFMSIKGGTFVMGDIFDEGESDEKPTHSVIVSDFYMAKYETTVQEFKQFIDATGYKTDAEQLGNSYVYDNGFFIEKKGVNWRCGVSGSLRPESENNHPVIHTCVMARCDFLLQLEIEANR